MSCNGCRVLRKGCSADCILRPCLQWLKSPQSQANATLFLAKFYGRAGLIHLISAAPTHLRPENFRSLLYEACGRIINPVYGSVGLMLSGDWPRCQAALEAVLAGEQQVSGDNGISPLHGCDIRHLSKGSATYVRRARPHNCSKRSALQRNSRVDSGDYEYMIEPEGKFTIVGWWDGDEEQKSFIEESKRAPSHDSFETVEPSLVNFNEQPILGGESEPQLGEFGLELTLGGNPLLRTYYLSTVIEISDSEE